MKLNKHLSFLLGAGFSAPMGYPIGIDLNNLLLDCNKENFAFPSNGSLAVNTDGTKPSFGYKTSYDIEFEFCFELIQYFKKSRGSFDYEEFYDYIVDEVKNDKMVNELARPFLSTITSESSLISGLRKVYTQVVSYFLKDKDGNKYYDHLPYDMDRSFPGYSGVMNCISELSNDYTINIHTLNHDLFFESFNNTDFLKGELCDGFEELGSFYYGKLNVNSRQYMVRLSRYTGNYNTKFRIYKLHGSRNYEPFYHSEGGLFIPETYIKTRFGIGHTNHYKEITNKDGLLDYENSWVNYHADFLVGTTSKIERYKKPLLFKKLFKLFRENLRNSEKLVIIGYGAKDRFINQMIFENFKPTMVIPVIIDPYPSEMLKEFAEKLNAKIVTKQLEDVVIKDID